MDDTTEQALYMSLRQQFGANGCHNETGTSSVTGDFCMLDVLEDAVFAALTDQLASGDSLVGVTLQAGTTLYGRFTAFQLTSGKVRAYKRQTP